jgi:hypothetical protein
LLRWRRPILLLRRHNRPEWPLLLHLVLTMQLLLVLLLLLVVVM